MPPWVWVLAAVLTVLLAVLMFAVCVWFTSRRVSIPEARERFRRQREYLEATFFQAAAGSGKPRGLRWKDCEWGDAVEFARDRQAGQLVALVGVTIAFEAIEGSDMEGLPAVGNLRNASAVFAFDGARWNTQGRAVFNLNPDEAIRHFGNQYERLEA